MGVIKPAPASKQPATTAVSTVASTPLERPVDVWGYLRSLTAFWLPALIVGLAVAGVLGAKAMTAKPTYTATSSVSLVPAPVSSPDQATQQAAAVPMLIRSYTSLAASSTVSSVAAKSLGNYKAAQVASMITMSSPNSSLLINYSVTSANQAEAARVANAVADAFVSLMPQMASTAQPTLKLVAANVIKAEPPLPSASSSKTTGLAIAVVAGLVAAFLTAAVLEFIRSTRRRTAKA